MDTRTHLREQRRANFSEFVGSRTMWLMLGLLAAMLVTSSFRFELGPTTFWTIEAIGLIGLAIQVVRLMRSRTDAADSAGPR